MKKGYLLIDYKSNKWKSIRVRPLTFTWWV